MWENSTSNVVGEFCGTSKVVSSAYLRITLTGERGLRSFAYMMYRQGPIPDPCTILAVIDFLGKGEVVGGQRLYRSKDTDGGLL